MLRFGRLLPAPTVFQLLLDRDIESHVQRAIAVLVKHSHTLRILLAPFRLDHEQLADAELRQASQVAPVEVTLQLGR